MLLFYFYKERLGLKTSILSLLLSLSNLAFLFNCFYISKAWNAGLYLLNILYFIGNFVLMVLNPTNFPSLVNRFIELTPLAVHSLNQIWHFLPLYLFKDRQTWADMVAPTSWLISFLFSSLYFLVAPRNVLSLLYGFPK